MNCYAMDGHLSINGFMGSLLNKILKTDYKRVGQYNSFSPGITFRGESLRFSVSYFVF